MDKTVRFKNLSVPIESRKCSVSYKELHHKNVTQRAPNTIKCLYCDIVSYLIFYIICYIGCQILKLILRNIDIESCRSFIPHFLIGFNKNILSLTFVDKLIFVLFSLITKRNIHMCNSFFKLHTSRRSEIYIEL